MPIEGPVNLNQETSRLQSRQVAGQQATGQVSHRAGVHTHRSQAIGARKGVISEAMDYLKTKVNEADVWKEATVFVFTAPLLEGEHEAQLPIPCKKKPSCYP